MKKHHYLLILQATILLIFAAKSHAQQVTPSLWIEDELELIAEDELEANRSWEDELEKLHLRLNEPINLNSATREELEQFPFLTDASIENILAHIYLHGEMATLSELQLVREMDRRTIDLLTPFVCVKPVKSRNNFPTLKQMIRYGRHEALGRFDLPLYTRQGYETTYLGPSLYHSLRYRYHYGDYLQLGITAEKDAGEPMFALHERRGYDFYSPYFLLKNLGKLKTLALGNYRLAFGQGLVLNGGFRLGKAFSLARDYRASNITKHSSTDEYNYFSGAAATIGWTSHLQTTAFYSHRKLGGTVNDGVVTSIDKTGLHRTEKEAAKRDNLTLQAAGGNVNYRADFFSVGVTGMGYFFSLPYEPRLTGYAKYNLHGQHFYNLSADYRLHLHRFTLSGEAAKGKQGFALLNRLAFRHSPDYQFQLIHRYYSHDYWALFAHTFGEGSTPQNENGWYLAADIAPLARWRFFASADFFSFPWKRYRISQSSQGIDLMVQATWQPQEALTLYANYRFKKKDRDVTGSDPKVTLPTYHHRTRLRANYAPGVWTLRTTADYTRFHQQGILNKSGQSASQGFHLSQLIARRFGNALTAHLQGSYFHTADYDSRIYASERGLLYTFYTPSFYGRGIRLSSVVRWDITPHWMLLLKYGHTRYFDRNTIGTGNDLIDSPRKCDLQLQIRLKI